MSTSVTARYRESRLGRTHVHVGRFVVLMVVIAVGWSAGIIAIMSVAGGPSGPALELVGVATLGSWVPALLLTVGWNYRGERGAR